MEDEQIDKYEAEQKLREATDLFVNAYENWRQVANSSEPREEDYDSYEDYEWAYSAWSEDFSSFPYGVASKLEGANLWASSEICW